jgi:hypothetical protein
MEIPVFDPELQRLIDDLDHIDASIALGPLLCGAQQQGPEFDPVGDESYLSLYDLCGGDPALVDTIKWANSGPSIGSSTTLPLVLVTPTPQSDDFTFPAPTVGGKWVPGFYPGLVPTYSHRAPTPFAPSTPVTIPTPCSSTPELAPASSRAGPSRSIRADNPIRHQPYRKAAPAKREASNIIKDKGIGRAARIETRDYLGAHSAEAGDLTRLQGHRALIREGRWGPIILSAIRQIGVPYPTRGLQKLLAELYDGEGEQEGIAKGEKGRSMYPWRVSSQNLFGLLGLSLMILFL